MLRSPITPYPPIQDVDRTFPDNERYETEEGRWKLRNVLGPYAIRNRAVGYRQSPNIALLTLLGVEVLSVYEFPGSDSPVLSN